MAVYTEVDDEELEAFVAEYEIGDLVESCKGIAEGVENSNYLLQTTRGSFILTLYEKRVKPRRSAVFPRPDGASRRPWPALPDAASWPRRARPAPIVRPARRDRHFSSMACGRGTSPATIAPASAPHWPTCIGQGQTFPVSGANALGPHAWRPLFEQRVARADEVKPGLRAFLPANSIGSTAIGRSPYPSGSFMRTCFPTMSSSMASRCRD